MTEEFKWDAPREGTLINFRTQNELILFLNKTDIIKDEDFMDAIGISVELDADKDNELFQLPLFHKIQTGDEYHAQKTLDYDIINITLPDNITFPYSVYIKYDNVDDFDRMGKINERVWIPLNSSINVGDLLELERETKQQYVDKFNHYQKLEEQFND